MPTVTLIKPQKNGKRLNIYLDDKFGFGIDLENFVTLGLKVEQELTEVEVKEIVEKAEFKKVYDKLLRFAMLRPRSEKEIKDWLKRKKVHTTLHKKLFKKLIKLDLVDDSLFAAWWVGQRASFKPRAKRVLAYELRLKGIDKKIIDQVLAETSVDEKKIAMSELRRREYKWASLKGLEKKKKMGEFLARKGFSWDVIKKAIEPFLKEG